MPALDLRILAFAAVLTTSDRRRVRRRFPPGAPAATRRGRLAREGERAGSGGPAERLRSALVVAEVAASVALLAASGLLIRALWRLQDVDPGFRTENVLTLRTSLPFPKLRDDRAPPGVLRPVLTDTKALPGVTERRLHQLPADDDARRHLADRACPARPSDEASSRMASLRFVTPGLLPGARHSAARRARLIEETDTLAAPRVAVVSESFAKQNFPGESPLGRRFKFAFEERTVVGVVGDIRVRGLERESEPQVYLPYRQQEDGNFIWFAPKYLVVRATVAPATLLPARPGDRRADRSADSDLRRPDALRDRRGGHRAAPLPGEGAAAPSRPWRSCSRASGSTVCSPSRCRSAPGRSASGSPSALGRATSSAWSSGAVSCSRAPASCSGCSSRPPPAGRCTRFSRASLPPIPPRFSRPSPWPSS